ncbi:ArsC family transcriptional regulator [Pseudomonas sp. 1D4]|uniref:arsenate reductase ArsC n=1 Tax=Pseudomonadaceae TaxID=135621 RepID=UPI00084B8696|nr:MULTISPECIES: arsenate reductase ArsC [Pseudomonas]OEC38174.1 ArsC family transcriptional regulator [Pseudomonas sp. 1D4]OEC58619.1 ArsC family transcriptional regulator [Pseudomonas sp. ENNP23]
MKVLFLCTANSCRSILSEAIFNALAPKGMRAFSAGSHPKGEVNPLALKALLDAGFDVEGLSSKSTDVYQSLAPDIVITVCDKAAGEACPVFFGPSIRCHWGLSDPSEVNGSEADITAAFAATIQQIQKRVNAFIAQPFAQLDSDALKVELNRIGSL